VRSRRLVLLELLHGHVVRLGHEAALGNLGDHGPAQPVGYEVGVDVVDQASDALVVVAAVEEELFSRRFVNEGADEGPHDGKHPGGSDDEDAGEKEKMPKSCS